MPIGRVCRQRSQFRFYRNKIIVIYRGITRSYLYVYDSVVIYTEIRFILFANTGPTMGTLYRNKIYFILFANTIPTMGTTY